MTKKSDSNPEKDAQGQFAKSQADPEATGVHSAKPTAITGSEDVTGHTKPPGKDQPSKDWDINFDITDPDKS